MTTATTAPKYEVRNVRTMRGSHDGAGFTAKLYQDGKAVADLVDDGWGGPIQIDVKSPAVMATLKAHVATLPAHTVRDSELPMTVDLFVGLLVEETEKRENADADHKRLIKNCQTKVLFRSPKDKDDGSWRVYNGLFTAKMRQMVLDKHGADCVFANETIAGQMASAGADVDAKAKALQDAAFRAKVIRGCRKDVNFRTADNQWKRYANTKYSLGIQKLIDLNFPGSFVANREWAGQIPA